MLTALIWLPACCFPHKVYSSLCELEEKDEELFQNLLENKFVKSSNTLHVEAYKFNVAIVANDEDHKIPSTNMMMISTTLLFTF